MALSDIALVTLVDLKTFLLFPSPGVPDVTWDPILESFINAVSTRAEKFCNRWIKIREDDERILSGNGLKEFLHPQWPISNVTAVYVDADRAFGPSTALDADAYVIIRNAQGEGIGLERVDGCKWDRGRHNIKVVCDVGYDPVPDDIQLGAKFWAQLYKKRMEDGDLGLRVKNKGDEQVTILNDMPALVREMFSSYVRTEFEMEDRVD